MGCGSAGGICVAGSSQAVLTQFLSSGAPLVIAVASGLVNLRMAVYSAAIAPRIAGATHKQRLLWATFLVDQTFISNRRGISAANTPAWLAFYLGCAAVLWLVDIDERNRAFTCPAPNCRRRGSWTSPFRSRFVALVVPG